MKKCVYTCITGNYDEPKTLKYKEQGYDYFCFTNNKELKSDFWNVIYLDEELDDRTLSRKVKILDYKYLKDYDLSICMDGSVEIRKPIDEFINNVCDLENYDMCSFVHKYRDCIYDEINANIIYNKESIEKLEKLEKFLLEENYPKHNGLTENTVLVRKHNKNVNDLMDLWYEMVIKYSTRDQLSFNYCLWKNPIKIQMINMPVMDNLYFYNNAHNDTHKDDIMLYFGDSSTFDYHNVKHIKYNYDELRKGIKIKIPYDISTLDITFKERCLKFNSIKIINEGIEIYKYNTYIFNGVEYFYDKPIVRLSGDMHKDEELNLIVDAQSVSNDEMIDLIKTMTLQDINNKINLKEKDEKISNLGGIINELTYKNQKKDEQYNNLINSTSWKITGPLRKLMDKIRNLREKL